MPEGDECSPDALPEADLQAKIGELEAVVAKVEKHDQSLRDAVVGLGEQLVAFAKRIGIAVSGDNFNIEEVDQNDTIYGFLGVTAASFYLGHRSTWQDFNDDHGDIPEDERGYDVTNPKSWSPDWLRLIARPKILWPFIDKFKKAAEDLAAGSAAAATKVRPLAESTEMQEDITAAASALTYPRVLLEWGAAQRMVHADPDGAVRAASTLIETTLKHVLTTLEEPLPADQSIWPLCKTAAKRLRLLSADAEDEHIRGMLGGMSSIVHNVGAHRTKVSDAHGRGPEQRSAEMDEARLAVGAAGVVCVFLMRKTAETIAARERKGTE